MFLLAIDTITGAVAQPVPSSRRECVKLSCIWVMPGLPEPPTAPYRRRSYVLDFVDAHGKLGCASQLIPCIDVTE